ncbi:HpcH/HpaI aldolase/citrate lyase family protein [Ensifer sp. YR511]|uniref:HpcH/HpaI aldolase family protein n=1 Tax=Ensifer sp. YR511 TaxID=1855294 RepID=UPI00087EEA5D|nr:aldolase/citrate lyase family protein [Ensifer sp. YR511]SDO17225.1 4-hydroxy-2-oxoheptanedioate aldolase [Ensifer sp. YR511]
MKALAPVRRNRVKDAIRQGSKARGIHMTFASPSVIELLGMLDFDFVYLDAEHGRFDLSEIEEACRAAEISDLTVIARVPPGMLALIGTYLDRGVQGIIVPHVSSAEEAAAAVEATFFRPRGFRSNGGARADRYWLGGGDFQEYFAEVNENTTLSIQIEDRKAVENLDEILQVPGIDYYTIGKNDLSASYDQPRLVKGFSAPMGELVASLEQRIRAAGFPMKDDVMTLGRVKDFIVEGGHRFLNTAA